jgi:hypothetical protein
VVGLGLLQGSFFASNGAALRCAGWRSKNSASALRLASLGSLSLHRRLEKQLRD